MAGAEAVGSSTSEGFFAKIGAWLQGTHVPEQVKDVDVVALFTNPWFIIPFIALIGYLIWKQSFNELIIIVIFIVIWWLTGTEYMQSLVVDGEIQIKKILPVLAGASAVLGFVIYLFFGRS
ncbi:hypothetical protein VU10_00175 [Desulfobulbus sp. US1]|nr:hypothetical protein [Desulfobulbus sp. US4]MCW5207713.1 hypothetical protein [Desulfobulbus sp. US2]MCW5208640.1 hypothetical protein [Desulfobulbus sp. US1]MCW5210321.1 hypothetical protein [Desulfobulbus sp. N3]MCW5214206.1 hypothetical protein [Desulfobulbus sp. US5]WLE97696.1 MAG: hypothetical protein QTN59_02415 [Candidatus Electrothrix communis]